MDNVNTKKKVQVNLDADVVDRVTAYLELMGLTPTAAINMFYRKIDATGELPFTASLTDYQKAEAKLMGAAKKLPLTQFDTGEAFLTWADKEYGDY